MLKAIGFYTSTFHYLVGFDRRAEKCHIHGPGRETAVEKIFPEADLAI